MEVNNFFTQKNITITLEIENMFKLEKIGDFFFFFTLFILHMNIDQTRGIRSFCFFFIPN